MKEFHLKNPEVSPTLFNMEVAIFASFDSQSYLGMYSGPIDPHQLKMFMVT